MKGFTLIEILIALLISTLVAIITFSGLHALLNIRYKINQHNQTIAQMQTTFWYMQHDIAQAIQANQRDVHGDPLPAFSASPTALTLITAATLPTQSQAPENGLIRVAYRLQNQTLYRITWPITNAAFSSKPNKQALLSQVESIRWLALDNHHDWQTNFNVSAFDDRSFSGLLPAAMKVIICFHHRYFTRIIALNNPLFPKGQQP